MRVGFIILLLAGSLAVNGQVVINEVCQNNADIVYDPDFFGFSSWVELYNPANASVNLSGYFLSDSPTLPQRWTFPPGTVIPAKGYLIVWIDSLNVQLHTNFSIEPGGGQILLSSPSSSILDQITYPLQYVNTSYCRVSNGGLPWRQSSEPTPSKANVAGPTNGPLPKVECNMPSGRYAGTVSVFLSQLQAGSEIRYTIDGSEPTKKSNLYASPFNVDTTLVVKAKAYHPDYLPSETVSVTYFMNEHAFTIPVVSLSANPKYLFNDTIGIYVVGINGITGNCSTTPVNFNQDWDRHAVFEYLDISGFRNYQQDLTFRLSGKCSRRRPQKSFALKARKEFGSGKIDYPLFDGKPIKKYDEFFLRNSGQDVNVTQFRDAFMQTLPIGMMDIDYMAYQPAALYINGQYWGIQNLREKIDGDYIENNYGISKNDIDLIQIHDLALEGTTDAWLNYLDSLEILDPLDPNTFKFIEKHVDVQEYINFLALEIYYANPDWPNNIKFWRQRSTNGKFRWILWDTDFGFGLATSQASALHPTLDFAANNPTYPDFSRPIRLALNVPQFRDRFIGTLSSAMGSTLATSRVIGIIDQFQTRLESEMSFHKQRWGGALADWNDEVEELKDFAVARNAFMPGHLASFFNLDQIGLSAS